MFKENYTITQNTETKFDEFQASLGNRHIDARSTDFPFHTVAGQLARDNEYYKVKCLQLLGASINGIAQGYAQGGHHMHVDTYRRDYGASANSIAQGYAQGGHHMHVDTYSSDYGASVDAIAQGYAQAGSHAFVESYRIHNGASVDAIAQGYAQAGYHEYVETYRTKYGASVHAIAQGYAQVGYHEYVETYRTKYGASVYAIARGYAQAGNHEYVETYRTKHEVHASAIAIGYAEAGCHEYVETYRKQYDACVDSIAEGYAEAGYHEHVDVYQKEHGASVNVIAEAYESVGSPERVKTYFMFYGARFDSPIYAPDTETTYGMVDLSMLSAKQIATEKACKLREKYIAVNKLCYGLRASVDAVAKCFEQIGNHEGASQYRLRRLLDSYLEQRQGQVLNTGEIKEYLHCSLFFIGQKSYRDKEEAVKTLKYALDGEDVNLGSHLSTLKNGNLGNKLQQFVKNGYGKHLVNKEVHTIEELVTALQEKIDEIYGNGASVKKRPIIQ